MFGDMAARLCGLAANQLGWRPDEFWHATPAELAGCLQIGENNEAALTSVELTALRAQYPDWNKP